MSQPAPGNLLNIINLGKAKKTGILAGDPQVAGSVFGNGSHESEGRVNHGDQMAVFQVTHPLPRRNPDSPATVLKKGLRAESVQLAISLAAAGARNRDLPPN